MRGAATCFGLSQPSSGSYYISLAKVTIINNHLKYIQTNQPTRCSNFSSLLLDVYVQLNMFRLSLRPSSAAYQLQQQQQPLVLPLERGGSGAVGRGRSARPRPTALLPHRSNGKTRG